MLDLGSPITQLQVLEHSLQGGGECRLLGTEPAKRLHRAPDHPRKQAPPLQSRSLGDQTPLPAARGSGSVRQSDNSIQIFAVATRVEVRAGVRKGKARESKCEIKFDTKTELGANLSFAT